MQDFRRLRVWGKAHELTLEIYKSTADFPKHELYGLTSQIRRCAISVPSNIAEGRGRNTKRQYVQFLQIAMGSASELEYYILLVSDLDLIGKTVQSRPSHNVIEIKKMLASLIRSAEKFV